MMMIVVIWVYAERKRKKQNDYWRTKIVRKENDDVVNNPKHGTERLFPVTELINDQGE